LGISKSLSKEQGKYKKNKYQKLRQEDIFCDNQKMIKRILQQYFAPKHTRTSPLAKEKLEFDYNQSRQYMKQTKKPEKLYMIELL